ncbi:MAG: hypothetical protein AABW56_03735 [Nanoarchaeota archaeon]
MSKTELLMHINAGEKDIELPETVCPNLKRRLCGDVYGGRCMDYEEYPGCFLYVLTKIQMNASGDYRR